MFGWRMLLGPVLVIVAMNVTCSETGSLYKSAASFIFPAECAALVAFSFRHGGHLLIR